MRLVDAAVVLDALAGGDGDLVHELQVELVGQLQRRRRVAGLRTRLLDAGRFDALTEHRQRLVDEGADDAGGEEAAAVVDDDRGLADGQGVVEHPGQRLVRCLLALDDLHQRHLVDRREEVDPDEVLLPLDAGRQTGDRQRGGVGTEQRVGLDDVLDLLEHLVLEVLALEHRLDHEVDALEVCGVGGRRDAAQQRLGLLFGGLPRSSALASNFSE